MQDDDLDALVKDLPNAAPPAGFADRVLSAHAARRVRRRVIPAAGALAALAAVLALVVVPRDEVGELTPTARTSANLGDRVVAVLEPAAKVRFDVDDGLFGARVRVEQGAGRAFYRVDKGTPVVVQTPAGDVEVHGTCFTVDVHSEDPNMPSIAALTASPRSTLFGAIAGAALTVAVLEGAVLVRNDHGAVDVKPGEVATAREASSPVVMAARSLDAGAVRRLQSENESLRGALEAARTATHGDPAKLIAENQELREKLKHLDEEIALVDADRKDKEGVELPFPPDLAPRFQEKALVAAYHEAFVQAGLKGDVSHIDCDEYPCIVYGDFDAPADLDAMALGEKLKNTPALKPYAEDEDNTSWWRSLKKRDDGTTEAATQFGVALWPKEDKRGDGIGKRIGFRNQTMWNEMRPAKP